MVGTVGSVHRDGAAELGDDHDQRVTPYRADALAELGDEPVELAEAVVEHTHLIGVAVPAGQVDHGDPRAFRVAQHPRGEHADVGGPCEIAHVGCIRDPVGLLRRLPQRGKLRIGGIEVG